MPHNMKHKPACPCCGGCSLPARLCVTMFNECMFDDAYNVAVTITGPDGVARTESTGEETTACFEGVAPGHYEIATHKDGCSTPSGSVDVACGDDKEIVVGNANCSPPVVFAFDVAGCADNPLPGAVCTISGASSGTATTDAGGHAEIPLTASGVVAWSVSHPSGRFKPASGSVTVRDLCQDDGVGLAMSPADGYACCAPGPPGNPYPISTSLIWTDCTGEYPFEIDPITCSALICVLIELGDVSLSGPSFCPSCTGGGSAQFPPTDIGVHPINALLKINFASGAANIVSYFYRTYTGLGGVKHFDYKAGASCPDCTPVDASRSWRMDTPCATLISNLGDGVNYETRSSVSYAVNSAVPFNLTATIDPTGNGYGPGAPFTSWSGAPPCATVVISEAV